MEFGRRAAITVSVALPTAAVTVLTGSREDMPSHEWLAARSIAWAPELCIGSRLSRRCSSRAQQSSRAEPTSSALPSSQSHPSFVAPAIKRELNEFLTFWLRNLTDQGHLPAVSGDDGVEG